MWHDDVGCFAGVLCVNCHVCVCVCIYIYIYIYSVGRRVYVIKVCWNDSFGRLADMLYVNDCMCLCVCDNSVSVCRYFCYFKELSQYI